MKFFNKAERTTAVILALVLMMGMLAACGQTAPAEPSQTVAEPSQTVAEPSQTAAESSQTEAKTGPFTIGVSTQGDVNDWQSSNLYHIKYALENTYKDDVAQVYYAPGDYDANKQINAVEDLLTKDIDALLMLPASEAALVATIEKAKSMGIHVILEGANALTEDYDAYIDRDNYQAGYVYAKWIGEQVDGKGVVALMMGTPGNSYTENVLKGATDAFKELYPDITVLEPAYADWSPAKGKAVMEGIIAANPQIDAVLCDGGLMAYGVIEAYVDADKPVPPVTADDWNGFIKKAEENNVNYALITSGEECAADAVDTMMKVLKGESFERVHLIAPVVYTSEQIQKMVPADMPDSYWAMNKLPDSELIKIYGKGRS